MESSAAVVVRCLRRGMLRMAPVQSVACVPSTTSSSEMLMGRALWGGVGLGRKGEERGKRARRERERREEREREEREEREEGGEERGG